MQHETLGRVAFERSAVARMNFKWRAVVPSEGVSAEEREGCAEEGAGGGREDLVHRRLRE